MNRQIRHTLFLLPILLLLACLCSCSVEKFISPNDQVLKQNQYHIEMQDGSPAPKEINSIIAGAEKYSVQTPNKHLLGLMRLKMRLYCLSNPKDTNWLNNYLRTKGEAPVVYDPNATLRTTQQLENLMVGQGSFNATVSYDTIQQNKHDIIVNYQIKASPRYKIQGITYRADNPEVTERVKQWSADALIQPNTFFDQSQLIEERDRLVALLQNNGYFYASKENILFIIDTSFADQALNIDVYLRNPHIINAQGQSQTIPLRQYHLDRIFIYTNINTTGNNNEGRLDTIVYSYTQRDITTLYYFIYQNEMPLKPQVIARQLFLFHNQLYRTRNIENSYNSLLNLRNFKYINFEFSESEKNNDSIALLDARIRLLTNSKQKFSLSLELNNSSPAGSSLQSGINNGNLGLESLLSYQNKNLFGGAELFKAEGSFLIELPKFLLSNGQEDRHVAAYEQGINLSLDLPTLLLPFDPKLMWQRSKPHTLISIGANYQDRSYLQRALANVSFGYSWSPKRNVTNHFYPIEMTFARFLRINPDFWDRIESITNNGRLKYQYSNHFILNTRYERIYTTQQINRRENFNYLRLSAESAGNLLYGLNKLIGGEVDSSGIYTIVGVPYSQYLRFNGELKHYHYLGEKQTFVSRILFGIGVPYGNSNKMQMPYEKSFFGGGPTTIRAWHLRRLGPGNFTPNHNDLFECTGDMTFVLNLEERFPLAGILEGAIFTDIGNVWLFNSNSEFPGGQFSFQSFIPSLAVGVGFGLRANVSILTIRMDVGLPAYDPGYEPSERWRLPHWQEYPWNIRNANLGPLTFNFGIDYPF